MRYSMNSGVMISRKLLLRNFQHRGLSDFKADKYYVFKTLGLETFNDVELMKSYREVFSRDSKGDLETGLKKMLREKELNAKNEEDLNDKAQQIAAYLMTKKGPVKSFNPLRWVAVQEKETDEKQDESQFPVSAQHPALSFEGFKSRLRSSAEKQDSKLPAVIASAALIGTSIGVIIPCMPILVQTLGMPPSEFGLVVAAFGISKMFGNLPSAYFVETYGRKPVMVAGLALSGIGIGGIGLTLMEGFGTPWLIGCRLLSGLGVSAFTGGTFMLLSDISTPLNRTRTSASVMSGFQGGAALGPALGAFMVNSMGVGPTYFTVGGCFAVMATLNHMFLSETMPGKTLYQKRADEKEVEEELLRANLLAAGKNSTPSTVHKMKADVGIAGSFKVALLAWKELLKRPALRDVMILYGAYWAAIAGAQMTLLPLMMFGPSLQLGASEIGMTFAFMAATSVAASHPVAYFADRHGKLQCMIGGCVLVASSIAILPHADSFYYVLAASVPLSLGSTTMSACPLALVTEMVSTQDRAQSMALLRTSSDVGLLIGATAGGFIADLYTVESAISGYSLLMAGSTIWFAARNLGLKELFFMSVPVTIPSAETESEKRMENDVEEERERDREIEWKREGSIVVTEQCSAVSTKVSEGSSALEPNRADKAMSANTNL